MNPRLRIVSLPDGARCLIVDRASAAAMDTFVEHRDQIPQQLRTLGVIVLDGTWDVEVVGAGRLDTQEITDER